MHVVATAGHVDHGKSTLVRALTGTDPDRLEEERRRGLSIELGYAWTELPGVGEVAFVDVPGHQRFLSTTLAGLGPVPVAMLVVAADDPWMPQAAEHLAALEALGVEHGLVVVSRADLTDPAPAIERAREQIVHGGLAGAPIVAVSARTGLGLDELRETLATVLRAVPVPPAGADVRLWVDRRFHVRGTGTVVTGTLPAGTVAPGDILVSPTGDEVRVRAVESLGVARERIAGPARVALALGGHAPESIARGVPLSAPSAYEYVTVVDVALHGDGVPSERPNLHLGSAQLGVHVRPLGDGFARVTLPEPLPLRIGDRAILRDPGNRALWGVRVLDPRPPRLDRRGASAARAKALAQLDGSLGADLAVRGPAQVSLLRRLGLTGDVSRDVPGDVLVAGDWLIPDAASLRRRLEQLAGSGDGVTPAEAARALDLPEAGVAEALVAPPLEYVGGRIRRAGRSLPPDQRAALTWLRGYLAERPFAAPTSDELTDAGIDATVVAALHREGLVLRLAPGVVVLPDAAARALELLSALPQPFATSQARQALGTSRRVILPLLAHLDATGTTVRLADDTRRLR